MLFSALLLVFGLAKIAIVNKSAMANSNCESAIKDYVDCVAVSSGDATKGKALELEYAKDLLKLAARSFDPDDTGKNDKCILSTKELKSDIFGNNGPLKGCKECQKYAADILKQYVKAAEDERRCLRQQFGIALLNQTQQCVKAKTGNPLHLPTLPDFDNSTEYYLDAVLNSSSYHIMAKNRLFVCGLSNPHKAKYTAQLLTDEKGLFPLHCNVKRSCRSIVSSDCLSEFDRLDLIGCNCTFDQRDQWLSQFDTLKTQIGNYSSSEECSNGIKNALGSWRTIFQNAVQKCILSKDDPLAFLSIDYAIDETCKDFQSKSPDQRNQALIALRMIRDLLDALFDRVHVIASRFCIAQC